MLFWCVLVSIHAADRLRQGDVVYLEDYLEKTVELKALRITPLTFTRDGTGMLDTLRANQYVQLLGIGTDRYFVQARATNGKTQGWAVPSDMEPIPEAVFKELQQKVAEAERIKQAIARGEIEVGLPQDAVLKILGKPKAKSSIIESGGSFEQWTYNTYKTVPVYAPGSINGTNVVSTFYQKVAVGAKIVTFQDKKVIRFEAKQEDVTPSSGQLLVPPVYVP